jgi:hypothetical protein
MNNWKTTAAGSAIAILELIQGGGLADASWSTWLMAAATAIFGAVAKDHNVTGGTVQNK